MEQLLQQIIDGTHIPDYNEVETLNKHWPMCIIPSVVALQGGKLSVEEEKTLRVRIALAIGDKRAVQRVLGDDGSRFDNFYPDPRHQKISTVDTIDAFLGRFASTTTSRDDIEQSLFNGSDTGSDTLGVEVYDEEDYDNEELEPVQEQTETDISMENVKIMLKKQEYQRALEIIQKLNLNNPKKSVYFADQIRFIRKLIIIGK